VDDLRVGAVVRAVRIKRGLRQSEVAAAAGVSDATVSLIELGRLEGVTVRAVRRVAASVGVSLPFVPRWRGPELARLLDEDHARMVAALTALLASRGWVVKPEYTFSVFGERGSIDILGWHPISRALLVIEVKTDLPDLQDLLSTIDRKGRLARSLARDLGWMPEWVGQVLVVPDETWARNVVSAYRPLFDAALPARTLEVRRWIRRTESTPGDLRGIWFLNSSTSGRSRKRGGTFRVRKLVRSVSEPLPTRPGDSTRQSSSRGWN
jgi:transcriptional regulator with XRE-family HTH domain